jgi:hypothetical protein
MTHSGLRFPAHESCYNKTKPGLQRIERLTWISALPKNQQAATAPERDRNGPAASAFRMPQPFYHIKLLDFGSTPVLQNLRFLSVDLLAKGFELFPPLFCLSCWAAVWHLAIHVS